MGGYHRAQFSSHGLRRLGLGSLGRVTEETYDEASALEFVARAQAAMTEIASDVEDLPAPVGWLTPKYAEVTVAIRERLDALLAEAREHLLPGTDEAYAVASAADKINNALLRLENSPNRDALDALLGVITSNPIALLRGVTRTARGAATTAGDFREGVRQGGGFLSLLWDSVPSWAKWAGGGAVALWGIGTVKNLRR